MPGWSGTLPGRPTSSCGSGRECSVQDGLPYLPVGRNLFRHLPWLGRIEIRPTTLPRSRRSARPLEKTFRDPETESARHAHRGVRKNECAVLVESTTDVISMACEMKMSVTLAGAMPASFIDASSSVVEAFACSNTFAMSSGRTDEARAISCLSSPRRREPILSKQAITRVDAEMPKRTCLPARIAATVPAWAPFLLSTPLVWRCVSSPAAF